MYGRSCYAVQPHAGYDFYTNYDSQKGNDLAENPYAELLFYWQEQERQIRVSGRVVKIH